MRKFMITVEGKGYEVEVEEMGGATTAVAPVAAPAVAPKAAPVAVGAGEKMVAPMPGMLVKFLVADGATVKEGDDVLVLEAMKMENDIAATASGVFKSAVAQGVTVATGDVLAVIS